MKAISKNKGWLVLVSASLLVVVLFILPQFKANNKEETITNLVVQITGTNEAEIKGLLDTGYKAEAIKWLELTRERSQKSNMDSHVGYIREYVEKAGVTLEDIGTNEAEIAGLLKTSYIAEATKWLQLTRERVNSGSMDSHVGYIREYVEKAGVTLEDIGTNEAEIAGLLKTSYIAEARTWLNLARERADKQNIESEIGYLRQYAKLAGVSLEDLGTTETELKKFDS